MFLYIIFVYIQLAKSNVFLLFDLKEEMMRGKPGYEHLNEPLHILVEGELPVEIIDARLMQAREILEDLLKPVVTFTHHPSCLSLSVYSLYFHFVCNIFLFPQLLS